MYIDVWLLVFSFKPCKWIETGRVKLDEVESGSCDRFIANKYNKSKFSFCDRIKYIQWGVIELEIGGEFEWPS